MNLEELDLDNPNLNRWDIVIFRDDHHWLQLGIVKSNYQDHNTDYSWNYIQTGSEIKSWDTNDRKEVLEDIYTPDIIYKVTWEWVEELENDIVNNIIR